MLIVKFYYINFILSFNNVKQKTANWRLVFCGCRKGFCGQEKFANWRLNFADALPAGRQANKLVRRKNFFRLLTRIRASG